MTDAPPGVAAAPAGLVTGPDGLLRCAWAGDDPLYRRYHDEEWGRPVADEERLFEKLCLEGFQAGLSWLTILRKRDAFRRGFAGFRIAEIAAFGEADVARLLDDAAIVRHEAKIRSAVGNARRVLAMAGEGVSFAAFLWSFAPPPAERPARVDAAFLKASPRTPASLRLSAALKGRGFTFVGPTILYAFMQAMGLVNDHVEGCACRASCEAARRGFRPPG